jgi:hypothetical protein
MTRHLSFLFFLLFLTGCSLHNKRTYDFEGGGSFITLSDSNSKKEICVIHSDHSIGVIFPAQYAEKRFGTNTWAKNKTFFTPDSALIRKIYKETNYQYCLVSDKYWNNFIIRFTSDTVKHIISREQKDIISNVSVRNCLNWQKNWIYYDCRYIGYFNERGEKNVMIQIIDFRSDPYKLKPLLTQSWIGGWHGWFYSNIQIFYFNVQKNLLSTDDDV